MKKDTTATLLWGLGVGAGLMYLFDPDRGKRRRALVRDKAQALTRRLQKTVDKTSRDLRNRVQGLALEAKSHNVPDEVLVERVRSKLGRLVSHPHAIEVAAKNGVVTLRRGGCRKRLTKRREISGTACRDWPWRQNPTTSRMRCW